MAKRAADAPGAKAGSKKNGLTRSACRKSLCTVLWDSYVGTIVAVALLDGGIADARASVIRTPTRKLTIAVLAIGEGCHVSFGQILGIVERVNYPIVEKGGLP
jgi:hypothetical protein